MMPASVPFAWKRTRHTGLYEASYATTCASRRARWVSLATVLSEASFRYATRSRTRMRVCPESTKRSSPPKTSSAMVVHLLARNIKPIYLQQYGSGAGLSIKNRPTVKQGDGVLERNLAGYDLPEHYPICCFCPDRILPGSRRVLLEEEMSAPGKGVHHKWCEY